MCQYLDPACFMANVFASCPDRTKLSFVTLRQVRDHVTRSLASRNVVIEWTRDSVMRALECYPNLFGKEKQTIIWQGGDARKAIKQTFDFGFSSDFVYALCQAVQTGTKENG